METMLPHGSNSYHSHKTSVCTGTEIGGILDVVTKGTNHSSMSNNGLSHLLCEETPEMREQNKKISNAKCAIVPNCVPHMG